MRPHDRLSGLAGDGGGVWKGLLLPWCVAVEWPVARCVGGSDDDDDGWG